MVTLNGHAKTVYAGGPGSGPQGGRHDEDKGPSYAGHSSANVKVSPKGQVKLKAPKNAAEANAMLDSMMDINDAAVADFAAAASLPPNSPAKVAATLRMAHVSSQMSRAISMSRPFTE